MMDRRNLEDEKPDDALPPTVQDGNVQDGNVQDGNVQDGNVQDGNVQPGSVLPGSVLPESGQPEDRAMNRRKLLEMIDACRPGSADIELSEMSPLAEAIALDAELHARYERTQQLDARLTGVFAEIEAPPGLHERMSAAIRRQGTGDTGQGSGRRGQGSGDGEQAGDAGKQRVGDAGKQRVGDAGLGAAERNTSRTASPLSAAGEGSGTGGSAPPRASAKRLWTFVAAAAAGLLIAAAGFAFWPRHRTFTYDELLNFSSDWYTQLRSQAVWQPLPPHEVIRGYPVADGIRAPVARWTDASSIVGQSACAYELAAPGARRAELLVIAADRQVAPPAPPLSPGSSTGGLMIGCWQSGNLVYVLIVEGDQRAYRSLLDGDAGPPLAMLVPRPPQPVQARNLSPACQLA